ncbi:acyltransferase family protein [Paenibacillus tyrfis]|uniref:acyltransferase family protein n=1 Tax=Paenibacillus tyrfis TaxID=1501230 RepID=UPI000B58ADEB|nr:acyltransferase [Paenibacillus tyrfis]
MRLSLGKQVTRFWYDVDNKLPTHGENYAVLDGVRGLAVFTVLLSHCGVFNMLGQGGLGVWLFFVLSGFLLSIPFVTEPQRAWSIKYTSKFIARRLLRIIPLYYFVILVVIFPKDKNLFWDHLIFAKADGHLWSLKQELIFYIIMPAIFAIIHSIPKIKPWVISLFLLFASFLLDYYLTIDKFSLVGNGKNLPFYCSIFMLGISTAYMWQHIKSKRTSNVYSKLFTILGLLSLAAFFITSKENRLLISDVLEIDILSNHEYLAWDFPWVFGLSCCILILSVLSSHKSSTLNAIFRNKILRMFGVLGYSMYLVHYFVLIFLQQYGISDNKLIIFFLTLSITFLISCVTYGFIEKPFMRLLGSNRPKSQRKDGL